jgi:hypothetical protein
MIMRRRVVIIVINESSPAHSGSRWEPQLNSEVPVGPPTHAYHRNPAIAGIQDLLSRYVYGERLTDDPTCAASS